MQGYRNTGRGRTDASMSPREKRMLLRLVCSAALLLIAVGMKLTAPELTARVRATFVQAVCAEMDVREVFSAMGRGLAGEGQWQEVCSAVFLPGEQADSADGEALCAAADAAFGEGTDTAQPVCMTQQMLGFAYAPPLEEWTLTSGFGRRDDPLSGEEEFHYGVDLAAEEGTAVRSFADGRVKAVGDSSSLGHYLIVEHADGYATIYAHCRSILVSSGEEVLLGETVAEVGQSGDATGAHLHFVLSRGSTYLNPVYYL